MFKTKTFDDIMRDHMILNKLYDLFTDEEKNECANYNQKALANFHQQVKEVKESKSQASDFSEKNPFERIAENYSHTDEYIAWKATEN